MPRARPSRKGSMYWWSADIAQLRTVYVAARRRHQRARRRRRPTPQETAEAHQAYRVAAKALSNAIADAKARCWNELVESLNRDPWGRPYKMVTQKLRPWVPPLTQTLEPRFVRTVVDTLFPRVQDSPPIPASSDHFWNEQLYVTEGELDRAVRRLAAKNTAPGPDGIPGRACVLALAIVGDKLRQVFTDCLRRSNFPTRWKTADLVLIKKEGRSPDSPSAFRPICLLDECAKLFERVIAGRIIDHLSHVGPDLSDHQFGFRQGRSTLDAIKRVRALSESAIGAGGVALAVSLDITNAFNSLPWRTIREALVHHNVPPYLRSIVGDYLSSRKIAYTGRNSEILEREVTCGVPQGSVLGPLLWNVAYDVVLRVSLPPGVSVVCYADDTLVLARGTDYADCVRLAELGVARVVAAIGQLGLQIAPHKTEALWFYKLRRGLQPPSTSITVGTATVAVGRTLKYLGLTLDSRWSFDEHFERLAPRVRRAAGALQRLLPNLGGPREEVRRLYAGVVRSMALYGSPVWSQDLSRTSRGRALLNSLQRIAAIRIARGYRTISFEAATLLARFPPFDLLAEVDARVYAETRLRREDGEDGERSQTLGEFRKMAHVHALSAWRVRLEEPRGSRQRVVGAIQPSFEAWMGRRSGCVTYRLTQILTGHGCFSEYLHRIGREATAECHHCDSNQDSAQHTLAECPAWESERQILVSCIGNDLEPSSVVRAMLAAPSNWDAVVSFCEAVMLQKEAAERDRERADPVRRRRRRRGGNSSRQPTLALGAVGRSERAL